MPAIGLFVNIFMYQGMICMQLDYILKHMYPCMCANAEREMRALEIDTEQERETFKISHFELLDFFDFLILTDIFCYFATLTFLLIYLIVCLYAHGDQMKDILLLQWYDIEEQDFLQS